MKRVLVDTNVALDFFLKRPEFFAAADRIFQAIKNRKIVGCLSASVVTDLHYLIGRKTNEPHARKVVENVYATFRILAVDRRLIREALDKPMPDFEDALQAVTAVKIGVNDVVTRDKEGFSNSGLQVYSPDEFLEEEL
jgi:predicted nucleic acid-binding protein